MKKILVIAALAVLPTFVYAQGTISFANFLAKSTGNKTPGVNAPILIGATGVGADGNNYYAEVFFASVGTAGLSVTSGGYTAAPSGWVSSVNGGTNVWRTFNTTTAGLGLLKGSQIVADPNAATGTQVAVQLRAWSASLGTDYATAFATWSAAAPTANLIMGASVVQTITLGSPSGTQPNLGTDVDTATYGALSATPGLGNSGITTPAMSMWVAVPEPSVVALAGLGLVGAFIIRRRK